jgi:lipopolysaccharide export system protein LptA
MPAKRRSLGGWGALVALGVGLSSAPAAAEKADRTKPLTMEADRPCTVDLVRQVSVCTGNVVIAQGTLVIRADRVELRETPEGYRTATALGAPGKPAMYRQKRDGGQEQLEGSAERVEYDARSDTLRFIGNAQVRRMLGTVPSEEIQGAVIVWDNAAELFSVQGGAATPSNPGGRVRAVLSPRAAEAAASAASAASAPSGAALRPSTSLGERR